MADGQILHARGADGIHVLRLLGEVRYPLAPALDAYLRRLFEGPEAAPAGFVIDLRETQAIDSTHLGLLARLANRLRKAGAPQPAIVTGRPDITEVLLSMGFDEEFNLLGPDGAPPPGVDGESVGGAGDTADDAALGATVLDAHRALMALNERNREQFADVVAALEMEQSEREPGAKPA